MAYDLLVCDLDGTLVDDSLDLAPELAAALRRAAARGLVISIATGRMPAAAERYRGELDVRAPLIYYNGALVRDPATGQDLLSLTLPRGVLRRAWGVFAHAPVHPLFFRDDRIHCLEMTHPVRGYCDAQGLRAEVTPDPEEFLRLGAFVKALLIGHPAALDVLREDLERGVGAEARVLRTRPTYLEVVPPGASKGAALHRLAEHLGVPLERVVAVGDEENDLEMLRAAGLGIAMPHAPDFVRAAAGRVAPAAAEGGLLALFRELIPERFA